MSKVKVEQNKIYCPVNGWDCPYYKNSHCTMYPDHDPVDECDDFAFFWDKDDDYISIEDE
jgi:hypothetical protein